MTTTMRNLIRTLSVAALLAAAAMSLPAGDVHAWQNTCGEIYGVPETKGGHITPGSRVDKNLGNGRWKWYICDDDGNWIIFIDEKLAPGTQPPQPRFPGVFGVPRSGGVLAQP